MKTAGETSPFFRFMEKIRLSPRLQTIADMVEPNACIADVGTDHGYLVIRLLQDGAISDAVATDIRPGPLSRAESNARESGTTGIRFCLCDGLSAVSEDEADTIIIAGMGGENIAGILERAPWTKNRKRLLLQPMSRPEELRRFLSRSGYCIKEERLTEDGGKIYSVIRAEGGSPRLFNEAEYYTGIYDMVASQPLFSTFLERLIEKTEAALRGVSRSEKETDVSRAAHLRLVLTQLLEMREHFDKGI